MQLIENGLIPIYEDDNRKLANARELHEFLESGQDFSDWIKSRILKYGFVENEDYTIILGNRSDGKSGKPRTEYLLTIDTAKEIAMVENNEQGRRIRRYFIEVEKRGSMPRGMTQAEILAGIANVAVELERKVTQVEDKLTNALDVFAEPSPKDWKQSMNAIINGMCQAHGLNYQKFKAALYEELEQTACCNIEARQANLRSRMKKGGATYKDCQAVSKIDVIDRDMKLRAIFESIVRKYQAKYA